MPGPAIRVPVFMHFATRRFTIEKFRKYLTKRKIYEQIESSLFVMLMQYILFQYNWTPVNSKKTVKNTLGKFSLF